MMSLCSQFSRSQPIRRKTAFRERLGEGYEEGGCRGAAMVLFCY